MKVYKFSPPYKPDGSTTYPEAQKKSGVYIIKKAGQIMYVGFSKKNLYKTMYRHFQKWNDKSQVRNVYSNLKDITVRIIYCGPVQADRLEKFLILKYKPKDNPELYLDFEPDSKEIKTGNIYFGTPAEPLPF